MKFARCLGDHFNTNGQHSAKTFASEPKAEQWNGQHCVKKLCLARGNCENMLILYKVVSLLGYLQL